MQLAALLEAPCHQLLPLSRRQSAFWLRVEEGTALAEASSTVLTREMVYRSSHVRLQRYLLGRRVVAYVLRFRRHGQLPRVLHRDWYVLGFFGHKVTSLRMLYDDGYVRLISGGKFNVFAFVYLRMERIATPDELDAPSSDDASSLSIYRSNL